MAIWTKAKLAEATNLKFVVLGGASPPVATKLKSGNIMKQPTICPCCNTGKLLSSTMNYVLYDKDCVVIIKDLKIEECNHCKEYALDSYACEKIDVIINAMREFNSKHN